MPEEENHNPINGINISSQGDDNIIIGKNIGDVTIRKGDVYQSTDPWIKLAYICNNNLLPLQHKFSLKSARNASTLNLKVIIGIIYGLALLFALSLPVSERSMIVINILLSLLVASILLSPFFYLYFKRMRLFSSNHVKPGIPCVIIEKRIIPLYQGASMLKIKIKNVDKEIKEFLLFDFQLFDSIAYGDIGYAYEIRNVLVYFQKFSDSILVGA